MSDNFFKDQFCNRCGNGLLIRTMSWFNNDTICKECSTKEQEIRKTLPDNGKDFEGCGFIPETIKDVHPDKFKVDPKIEFVKALYNRNNYGRNIE